MTDPRRIRRPRLDRTRPSRSWNPREPGPGDATAKPGAGSAPEASDESPGVGNAVDLGYRVVDTYLKQGQAAARMFSGGAGYDSLATNIQELGARWMQTSSDVAALWFEMMSASPGASTFANLMGGGAAPFGARAAAPDAAQAGQPAPSASAQRPAAAPVNEPAAPAAAAETAPPPRFELSIETTRPARVSFDLRSEAWHRQWSAHELRTESGQPSKLRTVIETPASAWDPRVIRVEVPAGEAGGTYYGIVVDSASGAPVGVLRVELS